MKALKQVGEKLAYSLSTGGMPEDEWKSAYRGSLTFSKFYHGSKSAIGGTALVLTASKVNAATGVLVKAAIANTGQVYVGDSSVTAAAADATSGFELNRGESVVMPVAKPSLIYVIGSAAGQKVFWVVV